MKSKIAKITLISAICIVLIFLLLKYDTDQILALCTLGLFISVQMDELMETVPKIKKKKESIVKCDFCQKSFIKYAEGYEKGKKYTKRTELIITAPKYYADNEVNGIILSLDKNGDNRLYFDNSSFKYARGYVRIGYCPMCGRKLVQK